MGIDINRLKNNRIRKTFDFEGEKIEIYNITSQNKDVMQNLLIENYNTKTQMLDIKEDKMIELMYRTLTNIKFDTLDQLQDALNESSHTLYLVQKGLEDILNEFAIRTFREQESKIDGMLLMVEQANLLSKTDELVKLTKLDKDKLEKDANKEMKKIVSDHKKSNNKTNKNKSTKAQTELKVVQDGDI